MGNDVSPGYFRKEISGLLGNTAVTGSESILWPLTTEYDGHLKCSTRVLECKIFNLGVLVETMTISILRNNKTRSKKHTRTNADKTGTVRHNVILRRFLATIVAVGK